MSVFMRHKPLAGQHKLSKAFFKSLNSLLTLLVWSSPVAHANTIAFIGDSISTGAVAHPDLVYDASRLLEIFRGTSVPDASRFADLFAEMDLPPNFEKPVRLWPTLREFNSSVEWLGINLIVGFSTSYLDFEYLSWGSFVGKKLGYPTDRILIAAQDGAKMKDGVYQVDRILTHLKGNLPEKIFIFFTGNDLCGPTMQFVTAVDDYKNFLASTLDFITKGTPASGGTEVYILSQLGILQISGSSKILNKKVQAHGKIMTCREVANYNGQFKVDETLAQRSPETMLFNLLPPSSASMCPTVFGKNFDDDGNDQRVRIASRIAGYRDSGYDLTKKFADNWKGKGINFIFLDSPAELVFNEELIAEDCFHLSAAGQAKLAQNVTKEILSLSQQ